MPSYRFCRSDDVPLLVRAYNLCREAGSPPMSVEDFKRDAREIGLWTSSCMVALAGTEPIGVLLAAKREGLATLVHRVVVRPDHRGQGHGRHLVTSLSAKLSILGPAWIVSEVPSDLVPVCRLLETCGYVETNRYTDFLQRSAWNPQPASDLVIPITIDELVANHAIHDSAERPWERSLATLSSRKDRLLGLAVASDSRIEAHLLYEEGADEKRIVDLGVADRDRGPLWFGTLLGQLVAADPRPIHLSRILPAELPFDFLRSRGFEDREVTVSYGAKPTRV